ncbi:hypothetical protein B0H10DRAFT_2192073 [Mycena sp. CBHHK59/15]|nr:hypothetical protein B0H10DRAFT_2192073 [Mycena sp. CBHHK59/15]
MIKETPWIGGHVAGASTATFPRPYRGGGDFDGLISGRPLVFVVIYWFQWLSLITLTYLPRNANTDDELENEAPPTNKVKKSPEGPSNFDTYGRVIMHFIGPFETARTIVDHGLIVDTALSGDEMEEDVTSKRLTESWTTLWQKFPGFHELMLSLSGDPRLRKSICHEIASGMEGARSDDTSTMIRSMQPRYSHSTTVLCLECPPQRLQHLTRQQLLA